MMKINISTNPKTPRLRKVTAQGKKKITSISNKMNKTAMR